MSMSLEYIDEYCIILCDKFWGIWKYLNSQLLNINYKLANMWKLLCLQCHVPYKAIFFSVLQYLIII